MWSEVEWKSLSRVQLFATPWAIQSLKSSRPEYGGGGLGRVAFPFSRASSQTGDQTQVSHIAGGSWPAEPQEKLKNTVMASLSFLQQIFPTQESNWGLLHCRWILYQLSH